jgi:hypothetical protein
MFIFAGFMSGRSEWERMEKKYLVYLHNFLKYDLGVVKPPN